MNAWVVLLVLSLTVVISLTLGIVAAYGAVNSILHAFAYPARGVTETQPVLLARKAQAGAD